MNPLSKSVQLARKMGWDKDHGIGHFTNSRAQAVELLEALGS